jgi:hypothetical protein
MSRKIFLPRPEVEKLFLTSSPCPRYPRRSVLLFCPVVLGVLRCSISAASSSFSSDDADRSLKRGKRAGCTVSTMDLSEARGLVLFRVVRGGIGITRRLGATRTPVRLQAIRYSPSNPSVSRTDWPPPEEDHRRWKGLFTEDAQAACDFSFFASKFSSFFHRVSVIAAILRAKVRRAIVGFMPLASNAW